MAYTFITFGCWNNRNYKTGEQPMDAVLEKVKGEINNGNPEINRIIVSGDNYYPEKIKIEKDEKIKNVYIKNLKDGIQKLKDAAGDTPVSMVMGNHDLETNNSITEFKAESENQEYVKKGNCSILQEEIASKDLIDYLIFGEIETEITDVALLMIDTTIYAEEVDENNYLPCYKEWFEKNGMTSEEITVKKIQDMQSKFVTEKIKDKQKIILIGHHPFFYKNKNNILIDNNIAGHLIEILKDKTIYYICADRHYYQYATIEIEGITIHQYIVGTGGAELDSLPNDSTVTDFGVTFSVVEKNQEKDQMKDYGFLKVLLQKDKEPSFEFKNVNSSSAVSSSSGGKKSRKRRNSKLRKKRRKQSKKRYRY